MKAVVSKINREGRGVLKAISTSQGTGAVLTPEYQTIFKNNGKPMVILDDDTTISLANAEFERLSGYTKKEIEGTKKWTEFVAREDRSRMKEYHLLRKSDPTLAPRCCEFRFVDRHGQMRNIVLTIGQIPGTNKSMASLQDVTNRRQAEVTQRASEERYKTFFDNSRDAVYITTRDGTYVDANRAALDLFGYTREELKKLKARQLYADPADAQRLRKAIEKKGFVQDFEVRLRKKNGTEMDCLFTVTALRGDDGSILEYQGIARDVTERKRAAEALRKSEERYRDIFDSMHEGYFEVDLAGNFTFFNQPVSKFFEYPRDELMGLNYRKYTSPEEEQRIFQAFNEVYKTGNPHEIGDYELIKKDGSIGIATFSVSLLRNAAGEPLGFRGVTRDMTEKRKTEATLQQSEENYRKILEMAPDGIAINRLKDERHVLVNNAFCHHTGYRREEIIGRSALELNLFCDRANHKLVAETLRKEGRVDGLEINFWAKDGTILNDLVSARPIRFKGEDCLLVVATNINALKKAEEALRESEERYRSIIEDTEASYFETDLGGNYTFVNDAECKMLGYTREELIGMNYRQLSHETIAQKIYDSFNETYKTGKPVKLMDQEIIRKDGTKLIVEVSASLMRNSEGKLIGFRGIARDISKRTQAEEALRQSEEKYRTILENITEGYFENDLRGNFTFFNDSLPKTYGYSRDELLHMNYRQYMDEENAAKAYQAYNTLYTTGKPVSEIQFEVIRKDGTKRYLENSVSLIKDAQGKPIGFRGISRDITARKEAEEKLRQSEERYRTIIETMQEGYFECDLAGRYTFANDALCTRQGYSREGLVGMSNREFQDETDAKKSYQAFHEVYKTGEPLKLLEMDVIRKDGTKGISEVSVSLIRDAKGNPIGFRGVSRDITARKEAEERLRQSEERYRTTIETMQEGYFEVDLDGNFTFVNEAECRNLGYSKKEELIGINRRQYASEITVRELNQHFYEVFTTGKKVKLLDVEVIKKDGTKAFNEISVSLIRDAQGKPIGYRGVSRDITERKKMEETLRQSEERYRTILETMQEGYYELDLVGNFTFVNDAEAKNLGYSREELIGMNNRNYQSEEEVKKSYQIFNGIYRTGEPVKGYTFEITKKDGTKAFHEVSVSLIRDEQGKPIRFRGVSRDVTERKQMEEALRQSEEKYRTIIETMQEGYFELDLKGSYTFANEALCKRQGYTKEELIGMNNRQFQSETDAQKAYQAFHEVYRTGEPNNFLEMEVIKKDGTKGISEVSVSLIRDAQGKPIGFRAVSHDVTERKKMEDTLRQSEERYRTILETMQEAYYEIDLAGNFTFVNDAVCKRLGYTKEELIGMSYRQFRDEANVKKTYHAFNEIYRIGEPGKLIDMEVISRNGTKGIYEASVSLIRDAQGKPIGFRSVSRDVTERKQMEEALRQSEEKYRTIIETMQEGYFELDLKGSYTFANEALCKRQGYTKEELIGMNNRQFQSETDAQKAYQAFHEVYRTGEPNKFFEMEVIKKDGTTGISEVSVSLIRDAQGKPIGYRGVSHDITERKKMEDTLRQSEERYRTIVDTMEESYYELDLKGNFVLVNDKVVRDLGYTKEELIGTKSRQYRDGKNEEEIYRRYNELYKTGEPIRGLEIVYVSKQGAARTYELTASLIRDTQGKPTGFRGVSRDVTERKQMEEALRQSEERYRTIVDTMEEGYTELDLKGNFVLINDKVVRDLGYTKEEFIGTKSRQYRDGKNEEEIYRRYNELYKTGEPIRGLEIVYVSKQGAARTYELTASLIRDTQGKPTGFRAVSHDITERKQMEEALRQSEEKYRSIIETMQDGYWETDLTGTFTFVNDAQCRMSGSPRERLVGRNDRQYTDAATAKKLYEMFNKIYRTGEPIGQFAFEYTRKDGTRAFNEVSTSLIRDAQGKPIGFRGISRDVTERKKAEEQLMRYATELERSNEEVKNFAYIVSHDLRVPLVNLKGYTSELRTALGVIGTNLDAALPHLNDEKRSEVAMALHEDVPEALEFINNSVSRMDSFINAVLILSRLGRQDLKPEPIDMNALVKTTLETMSHQIKEQGIEVHVGSLPQVVADRIAMERIVGNILSNAVKYVDPERPCRIEVAAKVSNGETIFTIQDTGRGITQEDMHKVFAPFRRAGKQDTQGEGMGLAYVQTLVRRHGGRIWCESEPGKGTTFSFTISTTFKQGASNA